MKLKALFFIFSQYIGVAMAQHADSLLWLEDVEGEKALTWVKEQNAISMADIGSLPTFQSMRKNALEILDAKDRIAMPSMHNGFAYNFWKDDKQPRGILRRSPAKAYLAGRPVWELLLDVDKLATDEKESWVFHNFTCHEPVFTRCLIELSRGGKDADVVREFDLTTKAFVKDGFSIPEAKTTVEWYDADTLLVGTDFGPNSLTTSGYPRIVKAWKRGTQLSEATIVYQGEPDDMGIYPSVHYHKSGSLPLVLLMKTFYEKEYFRITPDFKVIRVPLPAKVEIMGYLHGQLLISPKEAWNASGQTFRSGDVVALPFERFLKDGSGATLVFRPTPSMSVEGSMLGTTSVFLNILNNVAGEITALDYKKGTWKSRKLALPENGNIGLVTFDEASETALVEYQSYLSPSKILAVRGSGKPKTIASLPHKFNDAGFTTTRAFATSSDGTQIPYFVIAPKGMVLTGKNPTLLYGYGGFEISMAPAYAPVRGKLWLEQGGVFVMANIRGGGEFGPKWHQAALKDQRHKAYEDFAAVAQALIDRKITSPEFLGAQGGSNGGLLMGVMLTRYPHLFKAIVCQVPLLDMERFHLLLAGASWRGEYGSVEDPAMKPYIEGYSPYRNAVAGKSYPAMLFTTSTKDDRVHPGHARKMARKLKDLSYPNVWLYENIEGGHGLSANNEQRAHISALEFSFLVKQLMATAAAKTETN